MAANITLAGLASRVRESADLEALFSLLPLEVVTRPGALLYTAAALLLGSIPVGMGLYGPFTALHLSTAAVYGTLMLLGAPPNGQPGWQVIAGVVKQKLEERRSQAASAPAAPPPPPPPVELVEEVEAEETEVEETEEAEEVAEEEE